MKIYTKKGDDGTTGLLGGTRLPKHHLRIESYGTVDELNAFVGSLRDYELSEGHRRFLINIQEKLFTLGSHLAADPEKNNMKLPELTIHDVAELELAMDKMEELLPEMKFFCFAWWSSSRIILSCVPNGLPKSRAIMCCVE